MENKPVDLEQEEALIQEQTIRFIKQVVKLECTELLGIARILCVPLTAAATTEEKINMRNLEDIFSDMVDRFMLLGRAQRGELLTVIFEATKRTKKKEKK